MVDWKVSPSYQALQTCPIYPAFRYIELSIANDDCTTAPADCVGPCRALRCFSGKVHQRGLSMA